MIAKFTVINVGPPIKSIIKADFVTNIPVKSNIVILSTL